MLLYRIVRLTISVVNYSYDYVDRSIFFRFPVSFDSDIEKAKTVIRDAVIDSPFSEPGKKSKDGKMIYAPVYFIEVAQSALLMSITVYFKSSTPTEVIKDDINSRGFKALREADIEVPYPYTNVVVKGE